MKKIIAVILSVLSLLFMFTSCNDKKMKDDITTTTMPQTTQSMFDKNNGTPESTDRDSALANGIKNGVDKAEKIGNDIENGMEKAKEDIKDDMKNDNR